jgi:hypothetical protein
VNGITRQATLQTTIPSSTLQFSFTPTPTDDGANSITIEGLQLNGALLVNGAQTAITTIESHTVTLTNAIYTTDSTAPSGYTVSFTTAPILPGNQTAAAFVVSGAELNSTISYTITSSGGGSAVTGQVSATTSTQSITGLNLTGLGDGTLTVALTLRDSVGNTGSSANATVLKDTLTPAGYNVSFGGLINITNVTSSTLNITGADISSTYVYSITSSGGGTPVNNSGTLSAVSQTLTGINLSGLGDGTLNVSFTLTDIGGNAGLAVSSTVLKDTIAPTITVITPPANGNYLP